MNSTQELYNRFLQMKSLRESLEQTWQECYEFGLPQREGLFSGATNQTDRLFDGTAPDCVEQLAASIFSELTPPWSQWFDLMVGTDVAVSDCPQVAEHLQQVSATLKAHFNNSTFSMEVHQALLDLVTVGTACLLFEEGRVGEKSAFHFTAVPLSQLYVQEGFNGRLDTTFRQSQMTQMQIKARFPDAPLSDKIDNPQEKWTVLEAVVPRLKGGYDYTVFAIDKDSHKLSDEDFPVLKTGYFESSPFITFRWMKTPGENYGRSPVMKALPDIKTANKVVELVLKNATIAVTGIWQAEDDGVLNPANIRLVPGSIIPKAVGSKGLVPLQPAGDFDVSGLVLDDLRKRIRHALLNDKLGQVHETKMSATEVMERCAEMVRILGAAYGRLESEFLNPVMDRALYILRRRGEIPEIMIDGRLVKVGYKSPIARMQTQSDANNALLWLSSLSQLGTEGLHFVNIEALTRWLAGQLNVPLELIQGDDK